MSYRYSFRPLRTDGGGTTEMPALNTSTGMLVLGGDVEGFFVSGDYGDHWQVANNGVWQKYLYQCACIVWSVTESNTIYACVGNSGSSGGFLVSTDDGHTWSVRSTQVQFSGNHAAAPLPTGGWPRSIGNLCAQSGGSIYVNTYSQGVFISSDHGNTWANIALPPNGGTIYYGRSLAVDPNTSDTLYAAMYNQNVWKITGASTSPVVTQLTNAPAITEELKVVGNYIYAACGSSGIFRSGDSGATWTSLNGSFIDTTQSYWLSIDGYASGSNHIIIVGCNNGILPSGVTGYRSLVQLTIDGSGTVTYTDLSTNTSNIDLSTPPEGRSNWRVQYTYKDWLGGNSFTPSHILIDPTDTNRIFVSGSNGFYRSYNGGVNWQMPINGLPLYDARDMKIDPNDPHHVAWCTADYGIVTVSDGIGYDATTTTSNPPKGGEEGYCLAFDPYDSTIYLSLGTKFTNAGGDVYHLPSGATQWVDDALNLAGSTTLLVEDNFDRTTTRGWGSADIGGAWTEQGGSATPFSVNGTTGNIQLPASSVYYRIFLESATTTNSSGSVDVAWSAQASGAVHYARLIVRSVTNDLNNDYVFHIEQSPTTGVLTARIYGTLSGTSKQIGSATTVSYTAGQTITMQYVVQGTNPTKLYFNAWAGGPGNQPSGWMLTASDSTYGPQASGAFGVEASGLTGYTAGANFQFSELDINVPTMPANGPNGDIAIGLAAGRDNYNKPFLLAAVESSGLWRHSNSEWYLVSSVIATSTQPSPDMRFAPLYGVNGTQNIYVFDRGSGIYCSTDYGLTWTQVWAVTTAGGTNNFGYLALNPLVANELWVTTGTNVYKLSNANSGSVGSGVTLTTISGIANPGPIKITPDGVIYCINLPISGNPTQLLRSTNSGSSWESIGDRALGSFTNPNALDIASNGRIYIGTNGNAIIVGYNVGQNQTT